MLSHFNDKTTDKNKEHFETPQDQSMSSLGDSSSNILHDSPICLAHSRQFTHVCFTCTSLLLCPNCMSDTLHSHHELKTLEKGKSAMRNSLSEFLIRLESKSEILSILHDQFNHHKIQAYRQAEIYSDSLRNQFDLLIESITEKKEEIIKGILHVEQKHSQDLLKTMNSIRSQRMLYQKSRQSVQKIINKANFPELAQFYSKNIASIAALISENQIITYKQKLTEPIFHIDTTLLTSISTQISLLQLRHQFMKNELKPHLCRAASKIKLKKTSILDDTIHKKRESYPYVTMTPKQASREKYFGKDKKHSQSNILRKVQKSQITSMPASPSKEGMEQATQKVSGEVPKRNMRKKKVTN